MKKIDKNNTTSRPVSAKRVFATIIIAVLGVIILSSVAGLFILNALNARPVVAFYAIDESTRGGILHVLQATAKKTKSGRDPYEVLILDDKVSLKDALRFKKVDLLFSLDGVNTIYAIERAKKKSAPFDESILSNVGSNIRRSIKILDGKVFTLPLLCDFYFECKKKSEAGDILVDNLFFSQSDKVLLDTLGALIMSEGFLPYAQFVKALQDVSIGKKGSYEKVLDEFLGVAQNTNTQNTNLNNLSSKTNSKSGTQSERDQNNPLYTFPLISEKALSVIGQKSNALSMASEDLRLYMEEGFGKKAYITLGDTLRLSLKATSNYTFSYYSIQNAQAASFCVPVILGTLLTKDKTARNSLLVLMGSAQTQLSRATAFAPTNQNCVCRDTQSDDARYWISCAAHTAPPLTAVAFLNKSQAATFAKALRKRLKEKL